MATAAHPPDPGPGWPVRGPAWPARDPADVPTVPGYTPRAPVPGATRPGERQWQAVRRGDREAVRLVTVPLAEPPARALGRVAEVSAVRHRALVPVHDAVPAAGGRLALVLGWRARTRLSRALARRVRLGEAEVAGLLTELGGLLAALHRQGVVHGGLHAEEVWLDESGRLVVGDLALQAVRPRPGPVPAPELAEGFACSPDSDVWDLAVLARTCLEGRPPDPAGELAGGDGDRLVGPGPGSELRELLAECLVADPARRPAAEEVAERVPEVARRVARVWHGPPLGEPAGGRSGREGSGVDGRVPHGRTREGRSRRGPGARRRPARRPRRGQVPGRDAGSSLRRLALVPAAAGALLLATAALHGQDSPGSAPPREDLDPTAVTATGPARPGPSPTAASAEASPSSAEAAAPTAAHGTGTTGSSATGSSATGSSATGSPATGPPATGPPATAAPTGPVLLLQRLLDDRARAWHDPDPGSLDRALAPGSPALEHDRAALRDAADLGVDYPELAFTVEAAEVVRQEPARRVLQAEVVREGYRIVGGPAGQEGVVEPATRHRVRVVLTRDAGAWRIHDWQPVEQR